MTDSSGFAVIGTGYWGKNYVRLLSSNNSTRLVAVCDVSEERLSDIRRQCDPVMVTTNYEDLLNRDDIQAFVVCTHPSSHFEIAKKCLEAGKHVLVEKPMTISATDSLKLVEIANAHNCVLMVGHIFLYNHGINKVKDYISNGDIGKLYYLYARRTNLGPIRDDVNAIWDLAPHDISIFNYLLDDRPEWVSAVGAAYLQDGCNDAGFLVLSYPNGVVGQIHVSWADPNKVREIVVVGSNLRIAFNDIAVQEKVQIFQKGVAAYSASPHGFGEYQLSIRDGDIISPKIPIGEPLKEQVLHFVDCMNNGTQCRSCGKNGFEVVAILEALDNSMEQNGAPVRVDYQSQ